MLNSFPLVVYHLWRDGIQQLYSTAVYSLYFNLIRWLSLESLPRWCMYSVHQKLSKKRAMLFLVLGMEVVTLKSGFLIIFING